MKRPLLYLMMTVCFTLLTACAGPTEMVSQAEPNISPSYEAESKEENASVNKPESQYKNPSENETESETNSSPKVYPGKEPPGGKYVKGGFVMTSGIREPNLDAALTLDGALIASFTGGPLLEFQDGFRGLVAMENVVFSEGQPDPSPRIVTIATEESCAYVEGRNYVAIMVDFPAENEYSVIGANDQCLFWFINGDLRGSDIALVKEIKEDGGVSNEAELMEYLTQRQTELKN